MITARPTRLRGFTISTASEVWGLDQLPLPSRNSGHACGISALAARPLRACGATLSRGPGGYAFLGGFGRCGFPLAVGVGGGQRSEGNDESEQELAGVGRPGEHHGERAEQECQPPYGGDFSIERPEGGAVPDLLWACSRAYASVKGRLTSTEANTITHRDPWATAWA